MTNAAPPRATPHNKPAVVASEEPALRRPRRRQRPSRPRHARASARRDAAAAAPAPVPRLSLPAPAPMVVESTMMVLSPATVSLVARDHAGQLAKCEGSNSLHGDLAISFEINGAGKVVRSQMSSMIKNVKVAGCILGAVRSWQYPKPPSGSAKGVYSITYQ